MPVLYQNGTMTIVAHVDDDLLFMNPDISNAIAQGETSTIVYVTAGDAGRDAEYWQGRETGAKAAYSVMAGAEDWVDEFVTIEQAGSSFNVTSSYLQSAPNVRLYFLRIPDGAGAIADPADYQSLARLEDGTRLNVETVDGYASYTRTDLVNVLSGMMEAHDPEGFRLQVAEGDYAEGEHTDHVHATEFALEAMDEFSGTGYQVTHYVNYQSDQLAPNFTDAEAAFSLEVMQAYAAYDTGVTDEFGTLLPVFVDWTTRQHIAESYIEGEQDDLPPDDAGPNDPIELPDNGDDPANQSTYSLGDHPDNFYFIIDPLTGDLTTKDWFSPSLQDTWDADADYIFDVTRISMPLNGSAPTTELLRFQTTSEGVLTLLDAPDVPINDDDTGPENEPDDPVVPNDDPVTQVIYSLGDQPDSFYFDVDPLSGQVSTKDWFAPSLQDAWDANEDFTYDITLIATPSDGSAVTTQAMSFETTAENILTLVDDTGHGTGDDPGAPDEPPMDPEDEGTPPSDPPDPEPPMPSALTYTLSGPDAFLFEMAQDTGAVTLKDWFIPTYDDPWDQNEDNIYDLTRTAADDTDTLVSREFLTFEVMRDDTMVQVSAVDDIILALSDPEADAADPASTAFEDADLLETEII